MITGFQKLGSILSRKDELDLNALNRMYLKHTMIKPHKKLMNHLTKIAMDFMKRDQLYYIHVFTRL